MTNNYYQKHWERLWYQNLSDKEKDKRQKKARDRYQNLPEEQKEKSVSINVNVIRIFLGNKSKNKLSIWGIII